MIRKEKDYWWEIKLLKNKDFRHLTKIHICNTVSKGFNVQYNSLELKLSILVYYFMI